MRKLIGLMLLAGGMLFFAATADARPRVAVVVNAAPAVQVVRFRDGLGRPLIVATPTNAVLFGSGFYGAPLGGVATVTDAFGRVFVTDAFGNVLYRVR